MGKPYKLIKRLITALNMQGKRYIVEQRPFWSDKADKICTIKVLSQFISTKEWNARHPDKKPKDPIKVKMVKDEVMSGFSDIEILMVLAGIYKEGGNGERKRADPKAKKVC